jgi:endo-1,4-beta-D-glucanase Y
MNDWSEKLILINQRMKEMQKLLNDKKYAEAKFVSYDISFHAEELRKIISHHMQHGNACTDQQPQLESTLSHQKSHLSEDWARNIQQIQEEMEHKLQVHKVYVQTNQPRYLK